MSINSGSNDTLISFEVYPVDLMAPSTATRQPCPALWLTRLQSLLVPSPEAYWDAKRLEPGPVRRVLSTPVSQASLGEVSVYVCLGIRTVRQGNSIALSLASILPEFRGFLHGLPRGQATCRAPDSPFGT